MKAALCHLARQRGGPLLGLDSSMPDASLALVLPTTDTVIELALPAASLPSESLVAGIAGLLADNALKPQDIKGLVVGLGPGSFTGLRVGLATIKGLALGAGIPVYGISSMQALAAGGPKGPVVVVHDARRGSLYAGLYMADGAGQATCILADAVTTLASFTLAVSEALGQGAKGLAQVCVLGDMAPVVAEAFGAQLQVAPMRMAYGILAAASAIAAGNADDLATLCPRYLRTSSVGL
jgi:tRNA threonylcarbamoyladenosine biosynthesis protein TsaB